ncbi:hypothetical protein NZK35_33500 [Stieleria sp. ICT_E10.1]|uniref:hypothetical protein n=1 Tax=Stieleria sedimenti TaxID=2976331 RepID=UPI00217F6D22|nr:hypothetical protein [Stieleria sedimenti]MCS7471591.1 hypothetical protein [Stieleria sedimenti]
MSSPEESRALLLERLESRCMLAGGILFQVIPHEHTVIDRTDGGNRPDGGDRAAIVARTSLHDSDSQRIQSHHPLGQRQASVRETGPSNRGQFPNAQGLSQAQGLAQTQRPGLVQPRTSSPSTIIRLIVVPSSSQSGLSTSDRGGNTSSRLETGLNPSATGTETPTGTTTETLVSAPSSTTAATQDEVVKPNSRDRQQSQAIASDTVPVNQIPESAAVREAFSGELLVEDVLQPISVDSESDLTGTVQTFPLGHHRYRASDDLADASTDDERWELDGDALERLREVAEGSGHDRPNFDRSIDVHAIDEWFGESTGLIEGIIFEHDLPSAVLDINASVVDVVLDATIGMHRSVGLIAGVETDLSPDPASEIRGAILAVIAKEFADSIGTEQPPPVHTNGQTHPIRVSGIAYPGAAIIASLLAIGSRRWSGKRSDANHQTGRPTA